MQNKTNFKVQNTFKGVKRKLDTGFLRSDVCFLFSAASGNIEKSFGSPDNYPDEAKISLTRSPLICYKKGKWKSLDFHLVGGRISTIYLRF